MKNLGTCKSNKWISSISTFIPLQTAQSLIEIEWAKLNDKSNILSIYVIFQ